MTTPQAAYSMIRRPARVRCKECKRFPKSGTQFVLQTCPQCRAAASAVRAQQKKLASMRRAIERMDGDRLHEYLRRLAWQHDIGRAFGGDPVVLSRLRRFARAAAERINASDG